MGTVCDLSDFAKQRGDCGIVAFLKQKYWHRQRAGSVDFVDAVLSAVVPDEKNRINRLPRMFALGMIDNASDLSFAGATYDCAHGYRQRARVGHPAGCRAFADAAIVNQLHV